MVEFDDRKKHQQLVDSGQLSLSQSEELLNIDTNQDNLDNQDSREISDVSEISTKERVSNDSRWKPADEEEIAHSSVQASTERSSDRYRLSSLPGINSECEEALYAKGYRRLEDLAAAEPEQLKADLAYSGLTFEPHQLQEWIDHSSQLTDATQSAERNRQVQSDVRQQWVNEEADIDSVLVDHQQTEQFENLATSSLSGSQVSQPRTEGTPGRDDLTKINGIGPATAKVLHESGIRSFQDLSTAKTGWLQEQLEAAGSQFKLADPTHWSHQASFAIRGDWDGLKQWQSNHVDDREATESGDLTSRQETSASRTAIRTRSASTGPDKLTRISGIGPATAALLNDAGINTFQELEATPIGDLHLLLESGGSKFKLIDPTSWHEQASFALRNDWEGLSLWQGSRGNKSTSKKPAQHSIQGFAAGQQPQGISVEDLTLIRGICPSTQSLLKKEGIDSIEQIAELSGQHLIDLIQNANENLDSVEPESWPRQARSLLTDRDIETGVTELEESLLSEIIEISETTLEPAKTAQLFEQKS